MVLTARSHPERAAFDAAQASRGFDIERVTPRHLVLPDAASCVDGIRRAGATHPAPSLVLLDPVLPLGLLGPHLGLPYGVVLHGAEVTVPGRLPGTRQALAHVLRHASLVVSAGGYPAAEGRRATGAAPAREVTDPPGVDCGRFVPLTDDQKRAVRRAARPARSDGPLVVSVSRLVPRKGMDVLCQAAARLRPPSPSLTVAIGGSGPRRPASRPGGPAEPGARSACSAGSTRTTWPPWWGRPTSSPWPVGTAGLGLEQEGFGIVFLEAAAAGVPQVAGRQRRRRRGGGGRRDRPGGRPRPGTPARWPWPCGACSPIRGLRRRMGRRARQRAVASFDYARLAPRLADALAEVEG